MVEKIIVSPSKVRGFGNIVSPKDEDDFEPVECTIDETSDTINGVSMTVYLLEPDLSESTTLTVTSSSSTLVLDGTVTISATLKDSSNVAISGATVTFKEGTTTLGTGTTNSSGIATYTYTGTTTGSHTVSGVYGGDSTYASSTGSVSVTVNKKSTSTSLTTSSASVTVGTSVTLTATVTTSSTPIEGLTVTFKDGNNTLGTGTTNSSGVATYTTSSLTVATHNMTAVVTETSTYATSTSSSVSVVVYDHSYSLAFSSSTYTATSGSATLSVTLLDNNVAVSGATIAVTGSDSSSYTGITNSSGVAEITVTGVSAETTFTASYSNATATCTVTVSNIIFQDDCTSDNTSQYTTLLQVNNTSTNATLTYDSTEQAYTFIGTGGDYFVGRVIPDIRGEDNIKIRCKVKFKNTNAYNQFFIILSDSLNPAQNGDWDMWRVWGSGVCNYVQKDSTKYDSSVNNSYTTSNYCYIELVKQGTTMTANLYDSSMNLLKTTTQTGLTYSNPYFAIGLNARYNTTQFGKFIKEILVESV